MSAVEIDDTPNELLLAELVQSHAWRQVQARLLELRDLHVRALVTMKPDASAGAIQRELGYIHALNTMTAVPEDLLKKLREMAARETKT